ncbi:hypothetical protein [Microbispora hainanensis]|uniref:hypothetical protein n=1 Tax=Microbispora hainanensis TaxID=568844 RepID=UPI001ABF304E|nr:hypothetical protein [Microbispora hainanensis]
MEHRAASFPLRVMAHDVVLALFVTVMQVQGTLIRGAELSLSPATARTHVSPR